MLLILSWATLPWALKFNLFLISCYESTRPTFKGFVFKINDVETKKFKLKIVHFIFKDVLGVFSSTYVLDVERYFMFSKLEGNVHRSLRKQDSQLGR